MLLKKISLCTVLASIPMLTVSAGDSPSPIQTTYAASEGVERGSMKELKSTHLFTIAINLHPTIEMGKTPAGNRRVFSVSGGEFVGGRIRGTVMPVIGSDLLLVRGDGSAQQDVRMLLQTDDGD
jgi:hypothetical protein